MRRLIVAGLALLAFSFPSVARAQITAVTDDTIAPIPGAGHDYIHLLSETVNPANGSVSVNIGLPAPKGRGISLPFAITYNSGAAGHFTAGGGFIASQAPFTGGWGNSLPNLTLAYQSINFPYGDGQPGSPTETCYFTTGYMFTDVFGGSHALGLAAASLEPFSGGNCTQMGSNIPSFVPVNSGGDSQVQSIFTALCGQVGGNGPPPNTGCSYATPPLLVFDKAGTIYSFAPYGQLVMGWTGGYTVWPASMEDRNGNIIKFNMTNAGALTVTDTAGRPLVSLNGSNTNGYVPTVISVGGLTYSLSYTTANISYTPQTEALPPPDGVTNPPGLNCTQSSSGSATPKVLHSITLPNNETYQFTYDPTYGTLSEIQYPDGGWVKYTWKLSDTYSENDLYAGIPESGPPLSESCNFLYKTPVVATREVGFTTSSTPVLTQTFAYNTNWNTTLSQNFEWTSKSTTVQTTDNVRNLVSKTVYTYSPVGAGPSGDPGFAGSPIIAGELAVEQQVQYSDWGASTPGPVIRTIDKSWSDQFNLLSQETILDNNQTSEVTYQYGFGGAITQKQEYDFGSGAPGTLLRTTVNTYQTFAGNPLYRVDSQAPSPTLLTFPCQSIVHSGSATGTRVAETDIQYDGGTSVCGTAGTPSVTAVSGLPSGTHDETYYGPSSTTPAPRGNLTSVTKQCFPSCANPTTTSTYTYDETGQALTMQDPCGNAMCADMAGTNHTTTYAYTDSYSSCSGAAPPSGNTNAYLTSVTNPLGQITKYCYGYTDGQLRGATDENAQTTIYSYSDSLDRLTETQYPDGGQATFAYNDSPYNPSTPSPNVTTTKKITSSQSLVSVTARDGMGHVIKTQTTDPQGTIYVITAYDGVGKTYTVTNPYRSHSDPTYGTTTYNYDASGRATLVIPPDGTKTNNNVSTQYCGSSTLVTDQAAHWRRSKTDGLGRLAEVDEPNSLTATVNVCPGTGEPIWITTYSYDTLNDLTKAVQGGSHTRTFIYDSLKRLTSSANPETGTTPVLYTYDANSNVNTKKDARSITITYGYEPLNRMTSRTYSNGDPSVSYTYDQTTCVVVSTCYNIGRRTSMTDADGSESWAYDTMGREWGEKRTINSIPPKTTGYTYNLAGDLATLTYPSGRTITYVTDSVGRPSSAQDVANSISYTQGTCANGVSSLGVCYAPQGAITSASVGPTGGSNWLDLIMSYNTRLQPNEIQYSNQAGNLMSLQYNFVDANSHNNGNVIGITNSVDATRSQQFTYDQVNRLLTGETTSTYATSPAHCWGEAYVYDNAATGEYGNLTNINVATTAYNGCTQESGLSIISNAANQITTFSYDASGNTLNDTHNSYVWNAESEIKTAAGVTYTYDGDGDRVQKSNGKIYWYGAGTEILDESDSAGNITDEYVFFGGKRIAHRVVSGNVISYYGEDFLGTSRQIYSSASAVCYDADFYPFGGERPYTNTCAPTYKFEGKERDTETNNDDFGARYYSSAFGRWTSPDWSATPAPVPYADLTNPQSLNLYQFVKNDPETFVDADGHCCDLSDVINFVTGAANAYGSDNLGGIGRQQQDTNAGKFGQAVGDAVATFEGAEKMVTGGTVAVASVPADVTGVGALVGVPAGVAGLAVAGQGTVEAGTGGGNLVRDVVNAPAESRESGPKAADAPGVSSSGQATDEHGNKLGGSGKPQQHSTESNTREGARNKSLNEGSTAVNHPNPKQGQPHLHSGDAQGEKKPNSTHHNYPE